MAHFFFHLNECGTVTRDTEGRSFPSLVAAHNAALRDIRAIMCEELAHGSLCLSCHIDIADADGAPLERVRFRDAVKLTGL